MNRFIRKSVVLAAWLAVATTYAGPAEATIRNVTTQVNTKVTLDGESGILPAAPSCIIAPAPADFPIIQQPSNGTLSQEVVTRAVPIGGCGTPIIPFKVVFYTPNLNFLGTDTVIVNFSVLGLITFNISVSGGAISQNTPSVEVTQQDMNRTATKQVVSVVARRISRAVRTATRSALRRRDESGVNKDAISRGEPPVGRSVAFTSLGGGKRSGNFAAHGGGGASDRLAALDVGTTIPLFGYGSGYSAGEEYLRFGVWANGGFTRVDNDFRATDFDGNIIIGLAGADYWITEDILIGGFGGVEVTDVDTEFNLGELDSDGFTVGLYGAFLFAENFSLEAQFGTTFTDTDMDRNEGLVTGETEALRLFGSLGVTGNFEIHNFLFSPTVRHLLATEEVDSFTESDGTRVGTQHVDLGVLQFGGRAAYGFEKFEPYVSALVEIETLTTKPLPGGPSNDRGDLDFSAGVDFYPTDMISGGIDLNHKFDRRDYNETTLSASVSVAF